MARLRGLPIPPCPCCASGVEYDAHMVSGCTATGSADCRTFVARLWTDLMARHSPAAPPPMWIEAHLTQLAVALIPHSVHPLLSGVPQTCRPRLL